MVTTNYYRRLDGWPQARQNKPCDLNPDGLGGQQFEVDGLIVLRLRTDGIIERPIISPEVAEHRGLQLNETGKVKCV